MQDGRVDLAFLVEPSDLEGFTQVYLGLQPTSWVARTSLGLNGPLTPADLVRTRVIANQPGTIGYRQVVRWFASAGVKPRFLDVCSSVAVQERLIETGTGVGILPTGMVAGKLASGLLTVLDTFPQVPPVAVLLVHRTGELSRPARAFVDCVGETLSQMQYLK